MLQALIANKRAKAMEEAAMAQAGAAKEQATANLNTERGQRQERLKNAIEHLGSDSESLRLGGAYELFHLAEDTPSLRQTVLDILCAHVRRMTREDWYMDRNKSKPSAEIESLLTQVFVNHYNVFVGLRINLSESWLAGADLQRARLAGADLWLANLDKALLAEARLEGANLSGAYLRGARLSHACMREAVLESVHLQEAQLDHAELQGAIVWGGHLARANIRSASLQGADLISAEMYGADLRGASLEGARVSWASIQGAMLNDANLRGAGDPEWSESASCAERIRASVGEDSNLKTLQRGGLAQERVNQIVNDLVSPESKQVLTQQLGPFIDASYRRGLPEGHGAILGFYTQEEAEMWIAEHESALKAGIERDSESSKSWFGAKALAAVRGWLPFD
ncbi:MAG: pentapeptide repeat-containing protein [Bryobacterales bacterium]|nr:pentapeptide repeat-containing protein [Bryobacterales bacterium]